MHDLNGWSERRTTLPTNLQLTNQYPPHQQQQTAGAKTRRTKKIVKGKINVRYKVAQEAVDQKHQKTDRARSKKNNPNSP